jgi:hypothetical protein
MIALSLKLLRAGIGWLLKGIIAYYLNASIDLRMLRFFISGLKLKNSNKDAATQ